MSRSWPDSHGLAIQLVLAAALVFPAPSRAEDTFRTATLENGLTIILSPSTAHPVIALACFVATGGRTEDEYYQGSLHYIEHLVFKGGTPNLPPTQFRKRMSLLGRESGGWTWDDEINFGFEVPKENFREALGVFREALFELDFQEKWFEDEKIVVLQEMTRGLQEPNDMIYEAWDELAFVVHPYSRSVIGTEKAIRELDMFKTQEYYRRRFTPNHIVLSIAGDFQEEEMLAIIRESWGPLKPGPKSFELGLSEPEQKGPRDRTDFVPQATSALVLSGVVTPGGSHDDTPALEMLAALMNDSSFGLSQFLIEQTKWVTYVEASHYPMRDYGNFRIFARLEPENAATVTRFVNAFLVDFDATSIPAEVFEETRRSILFEEARERESAAARAARLGFLASRRGIEGARELAQRYESLTAQDVQAAKERWVGGRRLVTTTILPEAFDIAGALESRVDPGAPFAAEPPALAAAGALEPPEGASALVYEKVQEDQGVTLYRYANGLRVLVRPSSASGLVAMTARVLGGQWVEPEGKEGLNRFLAELGLRSTRRWDRESFARLLGSRSLHATAHADVGSRANTSRNVDYRDSAAHHLVGLASEWPTMLAILKETVFFPNADSLEIEKLREDLLTEVRALTEDNLELIKQEFYVRAYPGHPYGRPTVGTESSLRSITALDLTEFHRSAWTPDRVAVAVVGNVVPEELSEWIASRWADLPGGAKEPWRLDPSRWPLSWAPPSDTQILALGKDYWTVNWGRPGCAYTDELYYPSVVMSRIAGTDHFYKYVYGEGVSYRSWIRFWENLGPSAWILENDVKRERFDEILGMFDEDLARYSTLGFTDAEFADAVQQLTNTSILDDQDNARFAWKLAVAEGNGAGFQRVTRNVENLKDVTYEEVHKLAASIFAPERMLRVVQQ
jgi:zinc protease